MKRAMKKKPRHKPDVMQQTHVGVFPLGSENVDLYVLPNYDGGYFYLTPDERSLPRIKIGIDHREWGRVVEIALHESLEFLLTRYLHRYERTNALGDHASYLFNFDHCALTDICQRQSDFISAALPRLAEHYRKRPKVSY